MVNYTAPLRDMKFVLHEMLEATSINQYARHNEVDQTLYDAILEESAKFAQNVLAPLNAVGDEQGCTYHADGSVTTPKGFKAAFETMRENGWLGLAQATAYGGQGLPGLLNIVTGEMQSSANMAFCMYSGLTNGAIKAIEIGGTPEQKKLYLPKMVSGRWTGTMNLTESHCGTDLGLLKTKAVPQADGSYAITGQKIFISAGEHDLSENIVHLVLARIEGAPLGTKGISLFIVPKFLPDEKGDTGAVNNVSCGSIERKMGIHGNSTCVMNYDDAQGFLVGEENNGLRVMFIMMNRARLDVGMQGMAQSEVAYQNAATYARERLQGRALTGPENIDGPADRLIVHPDVRRMLMQARAFNEGARALVYWAAQIEDISYVHEDPKVVETYKDYLGLLTPVIKGYLTDMAMQMTLDCQQVYGGHGFIEEWGMSQCVRDTRITLIYEGANGVQALDLVGRKLMSKGGRALMRLSATVDGFLAAHNQNAAVADFMDGLKLAKDSLTQATIWLMENSRKTPNAAAAGSVDYMHMMGLSVLTYMWAKMALVAQQAIDGGSVDSFYHHKLITGRFFINRMLPMIKTHLARIKSGAEPVMNLPAEAF